MIPRRALIIVIFTLLLGLSLVGCATPMRKIKPDDIPRLPKSEGFYGGKIHPLSTPWRYQGSTAKYHHFYYSYNRGNLLYGLHILIARNDLALPFEQPKGSLPSGSVEVDVIYAGNPPGFTFARPLHRNPADEQWLQFDQPPPTFDGKLDLPR